jgi:hypothetical protein
MNQSEKMLVKPGVRWEGVPLPDLFLVLTSGHLDESVFPAATIVSSSIYNERIFVTMFCTRMFGDGVNGRCVMV